MSTNISPRFFLVALVLVAACRSGTAKTTNAATGGATGGKRREA